MTWSPIGPQTVGTSPARPKKNLGEANNHGVQARPLRTVSLLDSNMANVQVNLTANRDRQCSQI